ncbi:UNVERIFIED_CONTAM: hypothetical protein HDU68_012550 [Siphonaria sp. JEL0065]|nr:hypothetical protein HDU68_012550 [Siphonaria sp. JEL0065]
MGAGASSSRSVQPQPPPMKQLPKKAQTTKQPQPTIYASPVISAPTPSAPSPSPMIQRKSLVPSLSATRPPNIDETFKAIYEDAQKYGTIDVMLSINCWTMEKSALWLKQELETRGVSVWINQKWAKSGECEYEFSLAVRTNLISHDSNKTARIIHAVTSTGETYPIPGIRRPSFLPIKFPDVEWTENPAVEQLSCSTNFIVCDAINLLDPSIQSLLLPKILNGLYNLGIKITPTPTDPPIIPMQKRSITKTTNPVDLAQQVISGIQFQLQNAQDLFTLVSRSGSTATGANANASMFTVFPMESLYKQYLGYCANERGGCEVIWSLEFLIEAQEVAAGGPENHLLVVPVKGTCTAHLMSVQDVSQTPESKKAFDLFNQHVNEDHSAVAHLTGKFDRRRGLVVLDAYDKDDPFTMIRLCKYRIVLEQDPDASESGKSGRAGKRALGLFNPIIENPKAEELLNEWSAVIRLVATA